MRVRARSCPWITSDLKKQLHDRNVLKIKAIKSNDGDDSMRLETSTCKTTELSEQPNQICQADSRKTWQTINELKGESF